MITDYAPFVRDRRLRDFQSESEFSGFVFTRIEFDTAKTPYAADIRKNTTLVAADLTGLLLVDFKPRAVRTTMIPLFGTVFTASYDRGGCLLTNEEHAFAVGGTTLREAQANLLRELRFWRDDYESIPDDKLTDKARAQRDWINSLSLD